MNLGIARLTGSLMNHSIPNADVVGNSIDTSKVRSSQHFDNAITDASANATSWTGTGMAYNSTTKKFGTYSAQFTNGVAQYQTTVNANTRTLGQNDYCIEWWMNLSAFTSWGGAQCFFDNRQNTSGTALWGMTIWADYTSSTGQANSTLNVQVGKGTTGGGAAFNLGATAALMSNYTGSWVHVAVNRTAGVGRIYLNGVVQPLVYLRNGTKTGIDTQDYWVETNSYSSGGYQNFTGYTGTPTPWNLAAANTLYIGKMCDGSFPSRRITGYIDDYRITIGSSVYGSQGFVPPTQTWTV